MILNLFPSRPDHPLADAKEFKRILAELRVDKPVNAVDELTGWFESLKHARNFRLDHYFDLLRQLDDAGQQHLRRLAREYLTSPQLSPLERKRLWERSYSYWNTATAAYASCIERAKLEAKGRGSDAFRASLPLADTRLQAARRRCIKWLAYCYEPAGSDLWRELGQSYLAAEAAGHAQKLVQLYPGRMGVTSVAQQYLHSLLFSASSMDGLSPQEIELADRVIAHFLSIVSWSSERHSDSVYWVDAAAASPPARLAIHPGASTPSLRFVSPVPALSGLDELIHMVERDEIPARLNLGGEYSQKALLSVFRHLHVYWAVRPLQRRHQRHAVRTRMAVLAGFDHAYQVFSGALGRHGSVAATRSWVVENVSLGGFRVCFDDPAGNGIKLGTLLCMQPEGGENWLLGTARRFNRLGGVQANLGVQLISKQAQSIELRPRRSGFAAAVALPGIWLRDAGESGTVRIVLPLGSFNVRETLDFSLDGRAYLLTPAEFEESGCDYDIARFHDQLVS